MSDLGEAISECRALLARLERMAGAQPRARGETLDQWVGRWFEHRRSAGAAREQRIYELFVSPWMGRRRVQALTRDDVLAWVEAMDALVADDQIRWGTAKRRWIFLRAMLRDLCRSKRRDLRVRTDDITAGVRGPDRGVERSARRRASGDLGVRMAVGHLYFPSSFGGAGAASPPSVLSSPITFLSAVTRPEWIRSYFSTSRAPSRSSQASARLTA